jgi:hypothetical protein
MSEHRDDTNNGFLQRVFRHPFRPETAYSACGLIGLAVALPSSMVVAAHGGLSPVQMAVTGVGSFAVLLGAGMAAKTLTGHETLIYYRGVVAVFVVASAIPWILHRPVLMYMDVTILGSGIFLTCGRIGCLLVGCCHGQPSRWGIRYGKGHARCGFPLRYVGVRLFPIQAVESFFVFCLVAIGTVTLWEGTPPGTVLSFYIVAYALGRFFIEFVRGDAARRYFAGFSEAQWTSLLLTIAFAIAERRAILPASRWHGLAAIGLVLCVVFCTAWRRFDRSRRFELLQPRHVDEIMAALDHLKNLQLMTGLRQNTNANIESLHIAETRVGYRISAGKTVMGNRSVEHYSLSRGNPSLTASAALKLSRVIGCLKHDSSSFRLIQGRAGVFHLLFDHKGEGEPLSSG